MLQLGAIQRRVHGEWPKLGLEPIGLHGSRHLARSRRRLAQGGLDAEGHKTPECQRAPASITLRRYMHTLPGELERARDVLDAFLVARTATDEATG
jgi:hypothetical protein